MENMYFTSQGRMTSRILEPMSIRHRARFRGPRESEKFNLEAQQFLADVAFLRSVLEAAEQVQHITESYAEDGPESDLAIEAGLNGLLDSIMVHWDPEDATPDSDMSMWDTLEGLKNMQARIASLENRVKTLETPNA